MRWRWQPVRRDAVREYLRGALWALPSLAVLLALVVGSLLSLVTVDRSSPFARLVFQGTADDARTLLIGIVSTMVTVIALLLGLTVVALQLASTQYSPRVLRNFVRDRVNQVVLSVFMATFAYSTAGLFTVGVSGGRRTTDFPRVAVTGALVLLVASLVMLVFFVHHLVHSIQVDEVMATVERITLHVIEHDLPAVGVTTGPLPEPPRWASPVPAPRSGYVQTVHAAALLDRATAEDVTVAVSTMIGDHVVAGAPLAWVWRASPEQDRVEPAAVAPAIGQSVRIGFERTMEQDAAFGVRQLADIAAKALSPAVNDPYTAVQAVQHLAVILAELSHRPLGSQVLRDASGAVRVVLPGRDYAYYLDLACGQIRRYGRSEPRVMLALLRVLRNTARFCQDDATRTELVDQVQLVLADAEAAIVQPADLAPVRRDAEAVLREVGEQRARPDGQPLRNQSR